MPIPRRLKEFLAAMTGISHGANMTIARQFPWKDYRTFVDVGTAQGDLAAQIALANPHLQRHRLRPAGGGADLRGVRRRPSAWPTASRFVPGSFFEHDLPKADVVMMGHILHDWDLPTKKMLIAKAYRRPAQRAARSSSTRRSSTTTGRQNAFGLMMSLNMLIETPGGFDYTGADCAGWMKEAGFSATRVEHLVGPDSMVIGIK